MKLTRTPAGKACIATDGNLTAVGKTPIAAVRNLLRMLAIRQGGVYQTKKDRGL